MNQSKQLTDGAMLAAIFIILMLIASFVPIISTIVVFLLPVPFIIFASRHDWKPAIVMLLAVTVLSALLTTIASMPLPVVMGIGGIMIGSAIYRKLSAYETLSRGTIGFVLGFVLLFIFSSLVLQVNFVSEIEQMMQESINTSEEVFEQLDLASDEQMDVISEQLEMMTILIPAWLAAASLILAWISQWVSYKVINRIESKQLSFPPFRSLNLPVSLIWIYLAALILSLFDLDTSGTVYMAVSNIQLLTGFLMMLQGFSFIFYYAYAKKMSKALPVTSIIATVFLPFIFLFLIRLLGIIDIGFSLKERISNDNS